MNTYRITVNGKSYRIEIDDPNASPIQVRVNGKPFQVAVSRQDNIQSVSRSRESAELEEVYLPTVASTFVETTIDLEKSPDNSPPAVPAPSEGAHQVTAPMPGKILDIAVQVGSPVKHGATLCNLEAMKMKSPIRSSAEGTVAQILISEGQNVNFGDVLFTIQ